MKAAKTPKPVDKVERAEELIRTMVAREVLTVQEFLQGMTNALVQGDLHAAWTDVPGDMFTPAQGEQLRAACAVLLEICDQIDETEVECFNVHDYPRVTRSSLRAEAKRAAARKAKAKPAKAKVKA